MKEGQQYYHCKFFFARFWKENGSFLSKNLRLPLTFFVGSCRRGLPYPSPIRYMEKIKGSLEFLLEKEPFSFRKRAKKIYNDSIAVPLSSVVSFFHCFSLFYYYFYIFSYFLANEIFSNYHFTTAYLPRSLPIFSSHIL